MTEHTHQTTVAEARAKLAAIRARVEAMPPSTVPPEALHEPTLANANELISSLAAENETLGREIERLRAALRELLAVMPVLPAAAASIVGMRERYAVAIEEARRAAR